VLLPFIKKNKYLLIAAIIFEAYTTNSMLRVENVTKDYASQKAVDNISFSIAPGTIFGLLGPNGAGKSSLLRMVTGITKPDTGTIYFDGERFNENKHNELIGYMPEERGLYKKMKAQEQAEYLGALKGMRKADIKTQIDYWFNKLDMNTWRNKNVQDLSKGMSQKLQFVITALHQPKLLILDEPFSGLDPMNAEILKQEIYSLAENGTTIIFSTHRMEQVEEICDNIVLMNKGRNILEGNVADIKTKYKKNQFALQVNKALAESNKFHIVSEHNYKYVLQLKEATTSNQVLSDCIAMDYQVLSFNEVLPSLNEIFISLVEGDSGARQFTA
jgi:ABC-2 type transport system ATP-binding protein